MTLAWAAALALVVLIGRALSHGEGAQAAGPRTGAVLEREAQARVTPRDAQAGSPSPALGLGAGASQELRAPQRPPLKRDAALEAKVRARIEEARRQAARSGGAGFDARAVEVAVHVRELGRRGELVALLADRPLRPASNMKLVTSAAALVLLGPEHRLETVFELGGPLRAGRVEGPLIVRAGADPLVDPAGEGHVQPLLAPLIEALHAAGVRAIDGGIVLDEGTFPEPAPGPSWPSDDQWWQEFCALAGGFSANAGCLTADVRATKPGQRARVELLPRHHGLAEELDVRTIAARKALVVRVEARGGRARVGGEIPADVPRWSTRFAAPDPVELFGAVLQGALADAGVQVAGPLLRRRATPPAQELVRLRTPLVELLDEVNTESNNAVADQLYLALGATVTGSGTRDGGRAAVARALERLGVGAQGLVQVDGSGLSREDRVSARQITALLDAVLRLDGRVSGPFRDSLAVGGRTGTLAERMRDSLLAGNVHAKTGFIAGTSALSGVLRSADGRELVFSILVAYPNAGGLNTSVWKPLQDDLCRMLAGVDG